jgi:Putative glucose uptake permease
MILPTTYAAALLLAILTMICWGSWANTFKLTKKWRFELFYFDFSIGVLLAAVVAAYTFGSMGDDLSFGDNMMITGKRQIGLALLAGMIFNLANMLLVAAISLAGLSVAFPVAIGLAMVIGVAANYIINPQGNPFLLFSGALLLLVAIVVDALAYRANAQVEGEVTNKFSLKGLILSLVSGVLMGSFYPIVEVSKAGDIGLGPYSVGFVFAIGVFLSTFIYNLYFMNLPVEGEPISFFSYFKGSKLNHVLGILGGILWSAGAIANFVAASAPASVNVGPAVTYALGQGATLVSVLWGLLVWKEFKGADTRVKMLLAVMVALFIAGLALVSLAPLHTKQ